MKEVQSVILAGGRGQRMGVLTENTPKCIELIWYKRILSHSGISEACDFV